MATVNVNLAWFLLVIALELGKTAVALFRMFGS